jgi:alanine racemase
MEVATRRAWVDVDLGALQRNAEKLADNARVPIVPMIKADAYGIGAVAAARALRDVGVWGFGVAAVAEGEALRRAGIRERILVFSPILAEEFGDVRRLDLTPTLGDPASIARWTEGGGAWHLSIDTGMNRAGIPWRRVVDVVDLVRQHPPEGAFTHFHSAECNDASVGEQEQRFRDAIAMLPARPEYLHAENSPAVERRTPSPWNLARPGVFLYGVGGGEGAIVKPEPVAHFRARVVEIRDVLRGDGVSYNSTWVAKRDSRIATIAAGYADGFRRILSNRGVALVGGQRVRVAGNVTMDMTMLDVTDVACTVGDIATLIGRDGDESLDVQEVAQIAEMSSYEMLVGLKLRVPRRYHGVDVGQIA